MKLNREQAIDILERFDFFQGQRAGRELWNDKPFDMQEQDIAKFLQDVASLKNYINELTEENERLRSEWISVDERLPDNYRAVLVVCESTSISGGRLRAVGSYGGGFWSMADANGTMRLTKYMQYIVTHWMELPELPKGE